MRRPNKPLPYRVTDRFARMFSGPDLPSRVRLLQFAQKRFTESQASPLLGFPDATLVTPSFGVYIADNLQKMQLVLLANCRDECSTQCCQSRSHRKISLEGPGRPAQALDWTMNFRPLQWNGPSSEYSI
jgi:hypothetical protein